MAGECGDPSHMKPALSGEVLEGSAPRDAVSGTVGLCMYSQSQHRFQGTLTWEGGREIIGEKHQSQLRS